jgi:hypothetical protein
MNSGGMYSPLVVVPDFMELKEKDEIVLRSPLSMRNH